MDDVQKHLEHLDDQFDIWKDKKITGSMYKCTKTAIVFYSKPNEDGTNEFIPMNIAPGDILVLVTVNKEIIRELGLPLDRFLNLKTRGIVYADFLALAGYIRALNL